MAGLGGLLGGLGIVVLMIALLLMVAFYVYFALALMTIARKLKTEPAWLAWIPIANVYLVWKVSQTPVWTIIVVAVGVLLGAVPILGQLLALLAAGVGVYWYWRIAERRNYPGPIALLALVPVANVVLPGLLAWVDRK